MRSLVAFLFTGAMLLGQSTVYSDARTLVDRVQNDLKRASEFERKKGKETARYDNAQHHLSEFDKGLSDGKFDKDKLDSAIDDVKNVAKNNTLTPEDRDSVTADLRDLRQLRSERGRPNR